MKKLTELKSSELAALVSSLSPRPLADLLNASRHGFDALVGLEYSHASPRRVSGVLRVEEKHVQPYGLVHGGVYASVAESACSVGAAIEALTGGMKALGVESSCRFLQGSRPGEILKVDAVPSEEPAGERRRVWTARITDTKGRICAESRVVLALLEEGRKVGGEKLSLRTELDDGSSGAH